MPGTVKSIKKAMKKKQAEQAAAAQPKEEQRPVSPLAKRAWADFVARVQAEQTALLNMFAENDRIDLREGWVFHAAAGVWYRRLEHRQAEARVEQAIAEAELAAAAAATAPAAAAAPSPVEG